MDKIQGLKIIKDLGLPTIPWRTFNPLKIPEDIVNSKKLWTVRTSKNTNVNNPRAIGVTGDEALKKMINWHREGYGVIHYPFFKALFSGVAWIRENDVVIEMVIGDLWDLVTYGEVNYRVTLDKHNITNFKGVKDKYLFIGLPGLGGCLRNIRPKIKGFLESGHTVLLEWSVAQEVGEDGKGIGEPYLIFYEMRLDRFV